MKRSSASLAIIAILLAIVPVVGVWGVWEGNAGIAAVSEFPGSGLYAKSDMFPRNTIVEIENLETGNSVRAVITGSSGVAGLVAVLSPETASALNIRKGSVSRVRIRIPVPVGETPAEGLIASGSGVSSRDPDVNPKEAVRTSRTGDPTVPLSEIVEPKGERMIPADSLRKGEPVEGSMPAETLPVVAVAETESAVAESEPVVAETEPAVAETESAVAESGPVVAETEPAVAETESAIADSEPVVAEAETAVAESDTLVGEVEPAVAEPTATVSEPAPTADVPAESAPSEYVLSEPAPVYEEEPSLVVQDDAVDSRIDLVPAEPNPPVTTADSPLVGPAIVVVPETPVETPVSEKAPLTEPVAESVAEPVIESVAEPYPEITTEPTRAKEPSSAITSIGDYEGLPFVTSLQRGGYYVQIATYRDPQNARKVIGDHSRKYPIAIERTGIDTLKIIVGPVKKDECGAVLERFKGFGFKDAFVRRGK